MLHFLQKLHSNPLINSHVHLQDTVPHASVCNNKMLLIGQCQQQVRRVTLSHARNYTQNLSSMVSAKSHATKREISGKKEQIVSSICENLCFKR